jgi:hypothetical protein
VITGKDMAAQADKLTEGTKELLKRHAGMRVDVYPTHRTAVFPKKILDNTIKNATGAKSLEGGQGFEALPAPVPDPEDRRRGPMWNHQPPLPGVGTVKYELERRRRAESRSARRQAFAERRRMRSRADTVLEETDLVTQLSSSTMSARRAREALLVRTRSTAQVAAQGGGTCRDSGR